MTKAKTIYTICINVNNFIKENKGRNTFNNNVQTTD